MNNYYFIIATIAAYKGERKIEIQELQILDNSILQTKIQVQKARLNHI